MTGLRSKERERRKEVGPDAAGARQICRVAGCGFAVRHPQRAWRDGMGLTAWKGELGIGTEALDGRGARPPFDAQERDTLRELISTAVRQRAALDAKVWKEIKANGRPAAPQQA
jgi:hypothetical protein